MPASLSILVWLVLGTAVCARALSWLFSSVDCSLRARRLACQAPPPIAAPWWDLLGLVAVRETLAAARLGRAATFLWERHALVCRAARRPTLTYTFRVFGQQNIFTVDPANLQAVLATQFKDFGISNNRRNSLFPLLGNGIFTSNGESWQHSRAILRPSFARERVSDLDLEQRHNSNLVRAISIGDDGWSDVVDLQTLFFRLTIDSSTEFLFGESVNSQLSHLIPSGKLEINSVSEVDFARAFDESQDFLAYRARLGPAWWLGQSAAFRESCKKCHVFIDRFVQLALNRTREPGSMAPGKDKYIFLDELAQQTRDPIELRCQLLHILLAGRDTTAGLLGFLFRMLTSNPHIFAKLRRAVVDDFGPKGAPKPVSFASLKSCRYLQHCISETLRLYPVVPLNSRFALHDTTLPRGGGLDGERPVFVPKGQPVVYSVYVLHRESSLWGEDANDFKPDRWEGRRHSFDYLPFNAGPRICLGQNFALTSAAFATVHLLRHFDAIEGFSPSGELLQKLTLTSRPADGCRVRLHRAE